jgi:hypothetical protein
VWSSGVRSSYNSPFSSPPHAGKVTEDIGKAQSEVVADVFQHDKSRSQVAYGAEDVGPEVSLVIGTLSQASLREWLAGIAPGEYVDRLHAAEVQLCHVAVVGDAGEVVVKDAAGRLVVFHMPCDLAA